MLKSIRVHLVPEVKYCYKGVICRSYSSDYVTNLSSDLSTTVFHWIREMSGEDHSHIISIHADLATVLSIIVEL